MTPLERYRAESTRPDFVEDPDQLSAVKRLDALYHALKEAGWEDLGMVKSKEYQTKKNLWARPNMLRTYSKSELRRMVEQAPETGLKLVKG